MCRKRPLYMPIYLCFILIMLLINIKTNSIINVLIVSIALYIISLIYHRKVLGSWKNVFTNIQSFFMTCYCLYYIIPIIVFILDGYIPRIYYFTINYSNMLETSKFYLNIFIQFCLYLTLFGYPKNGKLLESLNDKKIKPINAIIGDLLATICAIYFAYLFLKNGLSLFNQYIQNIRSAVNGLINNRYIYIYMIIYTYGHISRILQNKKILKNDIFRLVIITTFWIFSIFIDRRALVLTLVMILITLLIRAKKVKLKSIFLVGTLVIVILLMAFFREGYKIDNTKFNDILYYSTGEFTLTNYVTVFYIDRVDNGYELLNGSTYTYYTISYLFPSFIFPNKPINLGYRFYLEANTNTSFAFNPVAEGLINFGKASVYTTPIILALYVIMADKLGKKNPMIYILMYGYSIDYMRGMFANSTFELIFFIIILLFFFKIDEKEEKNENIINIGNT